MERVIYEIKGMPKKMKRFFSFLMCIIYALGAGVLIVAFTAKEYTGLGGYQSENTLHISNSGGISSGQRTILYVMGFCFLLLGSMLAGIVRSSKRCYLKIFENHVEGNVAYGMFSKSFGIKYDEISDISSNSKGMMPMIIIHTNTGKHNPVFLDEPAKAEEIIRRMCQRKG